MQKLKENLPVIIGLCIPVAMVLVIAAVIYGEQMFSKVPAPTQSFIYAVGNNVVGVSPYGYALSAPSDPCAKDYYRVASGTLTKFSTDFKDADKAFCKNMPVIDQLEPLFFLYDVTTKKNTQLTVEEASKLKIDASIKSKDGYEYTQTVDRGDVGLFSIFGGGNRNYSIRYLQNGTHYEKIDLELSSRYSYGDIFVGWIVQ